MTIYLQFSGNPFDENSLDLYSNYFLEYTEDDQEYTNEVIITEVESSSSNLWTTHLPLILIIIIVALIIVFLIILIRKNTRNYMK